MAYYDLLTGTVIEKEYVIYNPFGVKKPFAIVQPNGDSKIYNRDEIKSLGDEYDKAAHKAIDGHKAPVEK